MPAQTIDRRPAACAGSRRARSLLRGLPACVVLGLVACGGGGSGPPPVDPICISFQPGGAADPQTVSARQAVESNCDMLVVDLVVTGVNDLFAASFTATYDPAIATYAGHSLTNSVLTSDGSMVQVLETETPPDLTLGLTRLAMTGVDVGGSGILVKLMFQRVAGSGNATLTFSMERLLDAQAPPVEIPMITWNGATSTSRPPGRSSR